MTSWLGLPMGMVFFHCVSNRSFHKSQPVGQECHPASLGTGHHCRESCPMPFSSLCIPAWVSVHTSLPHFYTFTTCYVPRTNDDIVLCVLNFYVSANVLLVSSDN